MIAQGIYKELRQRLKAAGHEVDEGSGRVDRTRLVELCQTLRQSQDADWVQGTPTRRRRLRLSSLFARGA